MFLVYSSFFVSFPVFMFFLEKILDFYGWFLYSININRERKYAAHYIR